MMLRIKTTCSLLLLMATSASAWAPIVQPPRVSLRSPPARESATLRSLLQQQRSHQEYDPLQFSSRRSSTTDDKSHDAKAWMIAASAALLTYPTAASAATNAAALPSALAAYGHFFSIMAISACIMAERVIIKPNMTPEEEDTVAIADTALGVFGILLAYTGYLRVVEYGKGWEYYSHETIFWLKITFVGIFGAASFFNTIKIVQRAVEKRQNGMVAPMSDKLASRMIQICNAELVALASIPLTASLMARGIGYSEAYPWQLLAGVSALVFGGLSFKYVKEALTWTEDIE